MPASAATRPAIPTDQLAVSTTPSRVLALGADQVADQVVQQGDGNDDHGGDGQQGPSVPPVELQGRAQDLADAHRAGHGRISRLSDGLAHILTSC
jgi:hypothetical protein